MSFLCDNAAKETKDVVVDLGDVYEKETQSRFDQLRTFGIGHKCFQVFFTGRLLMKPPPTKFKALTDKFPIVEGSGYWETTHYWKAGEANDGN